MGQTLSHGVYLPNEGERNCYAGLASNWQILNTAVGAIAEKAPLVHTHTVSQITDFPAYGTTAGTICEGNDSRLSDARTPVAHTHTKSDVTDLLNSNFIPSANNSYNLGSSSYQWSNVYANEVKTTLVDPYTNTMLLVRSTDNTWDNGARMFLYSNSYLSQGYGRFYLDVDHGDNNHTKTAVTLAPNSFHPQGGTVNTTYGVSLGTVTAQWAKVYAEQYYYNGTAWGLDKYNQWTEVNDFSNLIGLNGAELWFKNSNIDDFTANPSADTGKSIVQIWNKGTTQYCGGIIDGLDTSGTHVFEIVNFGYPLNSTNAYQHRFRFASKRDGTASFHPTYPNVDLGTSSNKWKTLNGTNPGALSLPKEEYTDVDISAQGLNWDLTGSSDNSYTPNRDGWLEIWVKRTSLPTAYISVGNTYVRQVSEATVFNFACVTCPVRNGQTYTVRILANECHVRIMKAEGNV